MIIMINGAFGVGKTTVSNKLLKSIENSMIFDPEEVGFMLRNIITDDIKHPKERINDFQALELWRILTVKVACELKNKYNRNLIIPMAIRNYEYFKFIYDGLKVLDDKVFHFCLIAKKETIHARLVKRGDCPDSWAFHQTDECIDNYLKYNFQKYIDTENITEDEVLKTIFREIKSSLKI